MVIYSPTIPTYNDLNWLKERGNIYDVMGKYFSKCIKKVMVSLRELWLQVKPGLGWNFLISKPAPHKSFDVWFDLHLNKRLSKQSWGWWVETPSPSLWRHCNADPLNKPFSQKINISCVEIRMYRVKLLNTIADDDLVRCVARSSASAVL